MLRWAIAIGIVFLIAAVRPLYHLLLNAHPAARTRPSLAAFETITVMGIGLAAIALVAVLFVARRPIARFFRELFLNSAATGLRAGRALRRKSAAIGDEIERRGSA